MIMTTKALSSITSMPVNPPLAVEKLPKTNSAKIEDSQGRQVACGTLVRYSTNQAYFVLQPIDAELCAKSLTVFTPDESNPFCLRVNRVFEQHPDRSFLPMYIQVHFNPEERLPVEHLIDLLAENMLGNNNLELRKNVTIDLFDSDADPFIRNNAGFIVGDRMRFEQVTVSSGEFLGVLSAEEVVQVQEVTNLRECWTQLVEFDGTLSNHQRADFLQYLFESSRVFMAKSSTQEEQGVPGFIVVAKEAAKSNELRILCLYASRQEVAEALVKSILQRETGVKNVLFTCSQNKWKKVRQLPSYRKRQIYRRHTRVVPQQVKWEQIYALNAGLNLF